MKDTSLSHISRLELRKSTWSCIIEQDSIKRVQLIPSMESIRVAVRIRPDEDSFEESCLVIDESHKRLKIVKRFDGTSRTETSDYGFDNIYGPSTSQETIFHDVRNLIDESLKGFNVTVFAFGMTGIHGQLRSFSIRWTMTINNSVHAP